MGSQIQTIFSFFLEKRHVKKFRYPTNYLNTTYLFISYPFLQAKYQNKSEPVSKETSTYKK